MSERRTAAAILAECEAKRGGATDGERELAALLEATERERDNRIKKADALETERDNFLHRAEKAESELAALRLRLTTLVNKWDHSFYNEWTVRNRDIWKRCSNDLTAILHPPDFNAMYKDMAKEARLGTEVRCDVCGKKQTVDPAHCLAHGWPKCHNQTMRLLLKKEPANGPA